MRLRQIIVLIKGAIQLVMLGASTIGAIAFGWELFTTPKSVVQGPTANPTPSQQIAGATGDLAGGTGQAAAATGSLAKQLGENPALLLIGGVVVLLVALKR